MFKIMHISFDMLDSYKVWIWTKSRPYKPGLKGVQCMKKMFWLLIPVMVTVVLCGCGNASLNGGSRSDYNAIIEELKKAKLDLETLKQNSVTKDEYNRLSYERDELKSKVEELEAAASKAASVEDNKGEEEKKEEQSNEMSVYGPIQYTAAPFSIKNSYGDIKANIEIFEITSLKEYGNEYVMHYTFVGTGDTWGIKLNCYDKDSYLVGNTVVSVPSNDGSEKFKVDNGYTYIPKSTVKIVMG